MLLLYLLWGGAVPAAAMAAGSAALGYDPVGTVFLPLVALSGGPLLAVAFGLRSGGVWALRLMRLLAVVGALLVAGVGVVGSLLVVGRLGHGRHDLLGGEFLLIVSAILAVPALMLFITMAKTRWLDPSSPPEAWEPPMRRSGTLLRRP